MIKGLIFNQAFWIQKTDDVANKLVNYDNLKNQVNDLKSFRSRVLNQESLTIDCQLGSNDHWQRNGSWHTGNPVVYVQSDGSIGVRGSND